MQPIFHCSILDLINILIISPKMQLNELPLKDSTCVYPIQPLYLTLGVINVHSVLFVVRLHLAGTSHSVCHVRQQEKLVTRY